MNRFSGIVLALTHTAIYAVVLTVLLTAAALVVTAATGGTLVRTKFLLFGAGWILMAYAVIRLWPTSPEEVHSNTNSTLRSGVGEDIEDQPRLQYVLTKYPPVAWLPAPPAQQQLDPRTKLFVASLFVLFASYLLETVFGAA